MTPAQVRALHRFRTQGLGLKPIARRLGVSRDAVRRYARQRGLAFPPPHPPLPPLEPALKAQIRSLHAADGLGRRRIFRRLAPRYPALTLWQVDLVLNPWQRPRPPAQPVPARPAPRPPAPGRSRTSMKAVATVVHATWDPETGVFSFHCPACGGEPTGDLYGVIVECRERFFIPEMPWRRDLPGAGHTIECDLPETWWRGHVRPGLDRAKE